jgi:energy-coupling factor transporter ATP-binding protein EcfA2
MTAVAERPKKKAEKPPEKQKRAIVLLTGESGTGKSFFIACLKHALIYDIDIGGGLAEYDERIERNQSERIPASSYLEILDDLKQRHRKGDLKDRITVAIDHVSALQQEANLRHNPTGESDYGRANARATSEWRAIREFCKSQDFNLVCVAHVKPKFENNVQSGTQPDGAKNIEGDMGIVLQLRRANSYPSNALVMKWRRDPEDSRGKVPQSFPLTLESFCKIEGSGALDRTREPIQLATDEQLAQMEKMLNVVKVPEGDVAKWFKKAGVESFSEMPSETIGKCIAFCQDLLKTANGQEVKP